MLTAGSIRQRVQAWQEQCKARDTDHIVRNKDKNQFYHVYIGSPGSLISLADLDARATDDEAFTNFRQNLNWFLKHFLTLPEALSSVSDNAHLLNGPVELRLEDKVSHSKHSLSTVVVNLLVVLASRVQLHHR